MNRTHQDTPPLTRYEIKIAGLNILLSTLGPFSMDSYVPSLPSMMHYFNTSAQVMQWSISLFLLSFALAQLILGPFSDRFGRRPIILIGLLITFIGALLCASANSIPMLLLGRMIQGVGIAAPNALVRSIMRDTFSGVRLAKMSSYTSMIFAVIPALAPIVGGLVQHYWGWRMNFSVMCAIILFVGFIVFFTLPETNLHKNPKATTWPVVIKNYFFLAKSPIFMGYALCTSLASAGIIAYVTVSPFLFQIMMGISAREYGLLSTNIAIGFVIGSFINARLVHHFGIHNTMMMGIVIMFAAGLAMMIGGFAGFFNVLVIIIPFLIFTIGARFIFSNAVAGAFTPYATIAGVAAAFYGTLQNLCTSAGSFLLSGFHPSTQIPFAFMLTIIAVISFVILRFWVIPAEHTRGPYRA